MNVIKDAVHGNVHVSDFELSLLDTPQMQRLRRLKQVGVADLVYPGANHTRFEHSIGTMHLASEMAESAGLPKHSETILRAAALLHDVGHGAFSHESETILSSRTGKTHEEIGWERISKGEIAGLLKAEGIPLPELKDAYFGKGFGGLITFGLGADRMDYLLRDSHCTGVAYGVIDYGRLIHTIRMARDGPVVEYGGLEAAESMLIARFLMFSSVYYHHAVRIASAMLRKACEIAFEEKALTSKQLEEMDDEQLLVSLLSSRRAGKLAAGLRGRKLFKRALQLGAFELEPAITAKLGDAGILERLEKEIAADAGVSVDDVLVDFPPDYSQGKTDVSVLYKGKEVPLESLSGIVGAIGQAERARRKLIVASVPEKKEKVGKAAEKILSEVT